MCTAINLVLLLTDPQSKSTDMYKPKKLKPHFSFLQTHKAKQKHRHVIMYKPKKLEWYHAI